MLSILISMVDTPEEKRKLERMYQKYNRLMYTVAYNVLKHHQDAEDAVLSSWEKIIRHLEKIPDEPCHKTKSLLVIITERTAIDIYRSKQRRNEIYFMEAEELPYFATKDKEIANIEISSWIGSLPKIYAEVLLLYYVNELSPQDIADLLSITLNTFYVRLHRGKAILKEKEESQGKPATGGAPSEA